MFSKLGLIVLVTLVSVCKIGLVFAIDAPCYSSTSSGKSLSALIITTSHDKLGDENCTSCKPTGVYGEEFTTPYYVFLDAGASVTLATIKGGKVPVDPTYNSSLVMSKSDKRFWNDPVAPC